MSSEKIKEFYVKLATNAEFKKDVENLKLHRSEDLSEECIRKIVSEIILPWGKNLGYNFSEAELLEFEKTQASSTKEKLNAEDLENVSGGINLTALLMAVLSFISPVNTLGTSDTALANRQESLTMNNPTLPTDFTTETLPIEYPKDESSRFDEPEQYLQDDGSSSEESIEKVEFSVEEEAISHDDFLKIIDDSKEVNATAVFLHNTMEANGTWALSFAEIEEAAKNAQATASAQNALSKEVQNSLNMLKILPTDEEGLKPYLAIEVDKFKDDLDEFLAVYNVTDIAGASAKYCSSTQRSYKEERKAPRKISRETILAIKETLVREYNARSVKKTKKRKHGGLGSHVTTKSFPFPSLEGDLQQLKGNIEGKEHYLDKLLEEIKNKLSDYDRAKVVHDWVAENIAYNYADAYGPEECEGTFRNHAEQVFKNKMGVCRGYAHLTELMMRTLGIPCVYTVSMNHAFNAIFIKGKWFLIDTTADGYKITNEHLIGFSRGNATQNYKRDQRYNQVTPDGKGHITHDYFPSNQDTAEGYNKKLIAASKDREVRGAMFHFDGESGVCEISMRPAVSGNMVIWDATRECIVDGELKLPSEILEKAEELHISDKTILDKIKKLHIPDNIRLGNALETSLKNMDEITVDPNNPHYIMYTPRLGKPGLYYRTAYRYLSAKPLWTKPD